MSDAFEEPMSLPGIDHSTAFECGRVGGLRPPRAAIERGTSRSTSICHTGSIRPEADRRPSLRSQSATGERASAPD